MFEWTSDHACKLWMRAWMRCTTKRYTFMMWSGVGKKNGLGNILRCKMQNALNFFLCLVCALYVHCAFRCNFRWQSGGGGKHRTDSGTIVTCVRVPPLLLRPLVSHVSDVVHVLHACMPGMQTIRRSNFIQNDKLKYFLNGNLFYENFRHPLFVCLAKVLIDYTIYVCDAGDIWLHVYNILAECLFGIKMRLCPPHTSSILHTYVLVQCTMVWRLGRNTYVCMRALNSFCHIICVYLLV